MNVNRAADMPENEQVTQRDADVVRVSWPVAAVALVGVLLVALAGAFALNQRFAPRIGTENGPVGTTAVATSAAAEASATSIAAGPQMGQTPAPAAANIDTALREEVTRAYQRYWEVAAQAELILDPSRLPEVMAGAELSREQSYIQELMSRGRAVQGDVEHNADVKEATAQRAVVYDEYVDRSIYVDPSTRQPLPGEQQSTLRKVSYQLEKRDGVWKVVDGTRYE